MKENEVKLKILRFGVNKALGRFPKKRLYTMRIGKVVFFDKRRKCGNLEDVLDGQIYTFGKIRIPVTIKVGDYLVFYLVPDIHRPEICWADCIQYCRFNKYEVERIVDILQKEIPYNILDKFKYVTPGVSFRSICLWTRGYIRRTDVDHTLEDTKLVVRLYKAFMEYAIPTGIYFIERYEKGNLLDICNVERKYRSELLNVVFDFNDFETEELMELIESGVDCKYIFNDVSFSKGEQLLNILLTKEEDKSNQETILKVWESIYGCFATE